MLERERMKEREDLFLTSAKVANSPGLDLNLVNRHNLVCLATSHTLRVLQTCELRSYYQFDCNVNHEH